ncbi:MAG: sensor histidine kinase [Desulfovibrio sp.]|uniref:sensor histidine kinase n=1 Tax=Desulfovibrio sp. TaxID=885 RepID=UPI00135D9084|nr:sensor histidine kinase [Desulfovibrio sp.]MTJ92773.1 sensor histidine kinase [Desulfovibrio sp.]
MRISRAGLLVLLLLLLVSGSAAFAGPAAQPPVVEQGVLDLSSWRLNRDGPVKLDGQWEFYWNQLLAPDDFKAASPAELTGYQYFPGSWKGFVLNGQSLPGTGRATFRLRIVPGQKITDAALKVYNIPAAYKIWANGMLLTASGEPGTDADTELAHRTHKIVPFPDVSSEIELVLQISNYHFRRGGVRDSIVLSSEEPLESAHIRTWGWSLLLIGGLLFMGVYHLVLHYWRNKDVSTLYFGLYCIVLVGHFITSDSTEWVVTLFVPNHYPLFLEKLSLVCYVCSASILYRFYRSLYKNEFPLFIQYFCDFRSLSFIFLCLTQTDITVFNALHFYMLASFLLIGSYIVLLSICFLRGHTGSLFLLIGSIVIGLVAINDIFCHMGFINSILLIQEGTFVFALSQAFALAQRFSNAFREVEFLSKDLEDKNAALETEMEERNRLEQEIIKVSEEERRCLSHDLHDGLCQHLAVARLRCSVLALEPGMGQEALTNLTDLSALLNESVSLAYDLSRGLWPVEHAIDGVGPSLEELARRVGESSGIDVDFVEDLPCATCNNPHLLQLYRIAQEAVTNAVKHAKPSRISIVLNCNAARELVLSVSDDGVGKTDATSPTGGLGLRIMAHRARMIGAELTFEASKGGGTSLVCRLQCNTEQELTGDME